MKWYERQKQLFAKKSEPNTPSQPKEPVFQENSYDHNTAPNAQPYDTQPIPPTYEEPAATEASAYHQPLKRSDSEPEATYTEPQEAIYEASQNDTYQQPSYTSAPSESSESTTIAQGTLINGNIESEGDLIIYGHICGDVLCNANLSIYGIVEGMINCNNAYVDNATIIGDIGCSGNMKVTESSTIDGNVEAYELINGGRIKGNATVGEGVQFTATSAIVGDISANHIEVERGAIIQGNMLVRQEVYFDQR